jgi:ATP synthase regulation protein NCA2
MYCYNQHQMRTTVLAMERLLNLRNSGAKVALHSSSNLSAQQVSEWVRDAGESQPASSAATSATTAHDASSNSSAELQQQQHAQQQYSATPQVLGELDLGKLMLLSFQLQRLLAQRAHSIRRDELYGMQEDLAELMGNRGLVNVSQQLNIVQRMMRSYRFFSR